MKLVTLQRESFGRLPSVRFNTPWIIIGAGWAESVASESAMAGNPALKHNTGMQFARKKGKESFFENFSRAGAIAVLLPMGTLQNMPLSLTMPTVMHLFKMSSMQVCPDSL